jgi:hypothetical protein
MQREIILAQWIKGSPIAILRVTNSLQETKTIRVKVERGWDRVWERMTAMTGLLERECAEGRDVALEESQEGEEGEPDEELPMSAVVIAPQSKGLEKMGTSQISPIPEQWPLLLLSVDEEGVGVEGEVQAHEGLPSPALANPIM